MPETGTRMRQTIPEETMLDRLAQSEQMREFFIQMWRQNPVLAKQAGAKVQNLMTQLDRGNAEENPLSPERGISLIELIMFIVIVSVGLAGIMMAMDPATKSSADPVIRKQALTIAESLLEEIELQKFSPTDVTVGRENYNDIFDYNGLTGAVYHANSSVAVAGLGNYSVTATVATLPAAWGNIPAASAAQITVTVNGPGGQAIEMTGYRVAH